MSDAKGDNWENDLLKLLFQAVAIANIADNAASGPLTNLYLALHTADPGEAGDQTTNECAYGSYARVAVARSGSGWTVTANKAETAGAVAFPKATGGSESVTWITVGTAASGAGKVLYKAQLTTPIPVSTGVTPSFAAGAIYFTES